MPYRPKNPEKYRDADWLREKYHDDRLSSAEIADICECSKSTILRWLDRHGIEKRSSSEATKVEWEGDDERRERTSELMAEMNRSVGCSYFMDSEGYMIASDGRKQVRIHRLVEVAEQGMEAIDGKDVHHVSGDSWLNFAGNTEVHTSADHRRLHVEEGNREPRVTARNV